MYLRNASSDMRDEGGRVVCGQEGSGFTRSKEPKGLFAFQSGKRDSVVLQTLGGTIGTWAQSIPARSSHQSKSTRAMTKVLKILRRHPNMV